MSRMVKASIWFHERRGHKVRSRPWGSEGVTYIQCVCGRAWFV